MRSIRRTLLLTLLLGLIVVSAAAGLFLYHRTRGSLMHSFDAASVAKVRALGALLELDGNRLEFNYAQELTPEYEGGADPEYFEIWLEDGAPLKRSRTLGAGDLPFTFGSVEQPAFFDLALPDGRRGRALGLLARVSEPADDFEIDRARDDRLVAGVVLVVARSREELDRTLASLRDAALLAGAALAGVASLLVLLAVRAGLRPIADLCEQVGAIGARSLDRRIEAAALPVELLPLGARLNDLLDRLARAFEREKRLTGNIAHELRTPVAELRAAAEVALRWPADGALTQSAVETARDVALRMGARIESLLRLARVRSGAERLCLVAVDVDALLDETWRGLAPRAAARGITLERRGAPGPLLLTDRELLAHALSNLLENAVEHGARGSALAVAMAAPADGGLKLCIENEAPDLAAEDLEHLTEPFWRKDPSRSDAAHSGLGLTLVAAIAEALGLRLAFHLDGVFAAELAAGPDQLRAGAPAPAPV